MNDIAGIPYVRAPFEFDGRLLAPVSVPAGTTDVIVMSHGWNNNEADAEALYQRLFESFTQVGAPNDLAGRTLAVVGVIWPSKRFDEMVASVADQEGTEGGASFGGASSNDAESQRMLEEKLTSMEALFASPDQRAAIGEMRALIPDLEDQATARRAFMDRLRSLVDPSNADGEDASTLFFKQDGNEILKSLKIEADNLDDALASTTSAVAGGAQPLDLGAVPATATTAEGSAGFMSFLSGFKSAAMNALNFTTYYEMKSRAGTVGKNGVAPLIDELAKTVDRIHLIGHSFGGRVVTSAAANSTTDKIRSMSLLQTAFSHNGFSRSMKGFFRNVVDTNRVHGPIIVTHTPNDKAVGIAYPLASRLAQQTAAKLGDANDKYGGLGRNGAQQMEAGEVDATITKLLGADATYRFTANKFFNLEASPFIKGHSDITGKEVARAVRQAIASA